MGSASVAEPQRDGWRRCLSRWRRDVRGAVYVEFLIAFLPVYTMFLCLIQLGLLFTVRLVVDHAAENAARAAADKVKQMGPFTEAFKVLPTIKL